MDRAPKQQQFVSDIVNPLDIRLVGGAGEDGVLERIYLSFEFVHNREIVANIERIYDIRHELLLLRRAVQPLQEMCNRMMRFDAPLIDQAMHPYFRDIQDHVIRLVENIDNLRDLLAAGLEAHLLLSSVEQNKIIKIFSVAAVVLMPPTLVASIYGMNFKSMPELEWPHGYLMALALMLVVAVLPYLFFKWKKWL